MVLESDDDEAMEAQKSGTQRAEFALAASSSNAGSTSL